MPPSNRATEVCKVPRYLACLLAQRPRAAQDDFLKALVANIIKGYPAKNDVHREYNGIRAKCAYPSAELVEDALKETQGFPSFLEPRTGWVGKRPWGASEERKECVRIMRQSEEHQRTISSKYLNQLAH